MKFADLAGMVPVNIPLESVAAATATYEQPIFYAERQYKLKASGFVILPGAAVTGDNTNTRYINLKNYDAAGSGTEICHIDLTTGTNFALGIAVAVPNVEATIVKDGYLAIEFEKVGNGVLLPGMVVKLYLANDGQAEATQGSLGAAT